MTIVNAGQVRQYPRYVDDKPGQHAAPFERLLDRPDDPILIEMPVPAERPNQLIFSAPKAVSVNVRFHSLNV